MHRVTVVLPTLNEADNVDALLSRILFNCRDRGFDLEVLVVDDGSTDGTKERVRYWELHYPVRLAVRNEQRGLAGAIQHGGREAKGAICVVMDADLSHEPEAISKLLEPIKAGTHDMVIGSRYVPGGSTHGWSCFRLLCSRLATLLAAAFTDVSDPLSGFFAVRREFLTDLSDEVTGFKVGLEILARRRGSLRVVEVPIIFHGRQKGKSKMSLSVILGYLRQLRVLAANHNHAGETDTLSARRAILFFLGLLAGSS